LIELSGEGACAAFVTAHKNDVRMGLGHASGDCADACGRNELHANAGAGIHLFQIIDKLGEILDGVRCRGAVAGR
jgi:hypothetical protein